MNPPIDCPCLKCGENAVGVNLADAEFFCGECSESFGMAEVEDMVNGWLRVLPWLRMHPALGCRRPGEAVYAE